MVSAVERAMEVHGFEEQAAESPWCVQCDEFLKWPGHDECIGCLSQGGRPAETVTFRSVHYDTAVLHAVIRRKRAQWEQRHPGWELVPDFARYWEDSTHPSKYVDRETTIGRKLAWTRFRVERRHPRGKRSKDGTDTASGARGDRVEPVEPVEPVERVEPGDGGAMGAGRAGLGDRDAAHVGDVAVEVGGAAWRTAGGCAGGQR